MGVGWGGGQRWCAGGIHAVDSTHQLDDLVAPVYFAAALLLFTG